MELSTLRLRAERLMCTLGEAERARLARSAAYDLATIFAPFSDLASGEAFALARESLASATDDAARAAARRRLDLVRQAAEGRRTARLEDERRASEGRATLQQPNGAIPFRESGFRLMNEPNRGSRAALARAREHAIASLDAPLARRVAECQELAGGWGYGSYEALLAECRGVDFAALGEEAQALLHSTEDAYRDLMEFALRHLHLRVGLLPRGEAAAHDLERARRLQPLDDVFASRKLIRVAHGLLDAVDLSPTAGGRIDLEAVETPPGTGEAPVIAIAVPDEIAVVLRPAGGAPDYRALLAGLGEAQYLAAARPSLPAEDRLFGDAAVRGAFGRVFGQLPMDAGFLRRFLDVDSGEAVEAARLVAIDALRELRLHCAQLGFERTLYAEGARAELMGLYREAMRKALLVDWPVETWLWSVQPGLPAASRLRASALEAVLHDRVLEEANEDWWRNPRTGHVLGALYASGRMTVAEEFAKGLGRALSLQGAADRLIAVAAR